MQIQYPMMAKIEVEMTQEIEMDQLPNRPSKLPFISRIFFPFEKFCQIAAVFKTNWVILFDDFLFRRNFL